MALSLIKNFSGDALALNYAGNRIVVMESPAPYSDRETISSSAVGSDVTVTTTSNYVRCNKTVAAAGTVGLSAAFFMLYDADGPLTYTLTYGAGISSSVQASMQTQVSGTGVTTLNLGSATLSGTLAKPYLRYRVNFAVAGTAVSPYTVGDMWIQVTIT
jgi:hypothetical protein